MLIVVYGGGERGIDASRPANIASCWAIRRSNSGRLARSRELIRNSLLPTLDWVPEDRMVDTCGDMQAVCMANMANRGGPRGLGVPVDTLSCYNLQALLVQY